jgi:hypothetical protein
MSTANSKLKIDFGYDSLGTSNVQGSLGITGDLSVGGNLAFSGTTVGNFIPDADQRNLGNTVNRWNLIGYSANLASTLTVTGSTSLQDTLTVTKTINGGNTTITGFANVSTSVNSASLTVGTSFIANTTGVYHTGVVNAGSLSTSGFVINTTAFTPTSNTILLGNTIGRFVISANTGNFSGDVTVSGNTTVNNATLNGTLQTISGNVNIDSGTLFVDSINNRIGIGITTPGVAFDVSGSANISSGVNSSLFTVGASLIGNTTGLYHTGVVNAASHTVGSSFIANSTAVTVSGVANLTTATSTIRVGNSSVNTFVNSSSISTSVGIFSTSASVGSNVGVSTSGIQIGNSTANLNANSILISVSDSTSTSNISPTGFVVGSFNANNSTLTVNVGSFVIGANVGSNVNLTTSDFQIGNSTANIFANSVLLKISNSSSTANLSPLDLKIGTAVVNSTFISINAGNFTSGANVGANVNLTTVALQIGNSSVNTQVNSSVFSTTTGNFSLGANVGANVKLTTVIFSIGNSTVNSTVNSTTFFTTGVANVATSVNSALITVGTSFVANTTGAYHTGVVNSASVNAASHTVGSDFIANSTVLISTGYANISTSVNSSLLTVGSSFIANTTGVYHTGVVNAASHTVGSSFIANTTGAFHTGVVNAASHTVGASFIANSSGIVHTGTANIGSSQITSLGVGTAASGTVGEIRANNNITAFYSSDAKFKTNIENIESPLYKVCYIGGKTFDWTDQYIADHGGEDGYFITKSDFGVVAQDVQSVFPLAVRIRGDGSLAVNYEKLSSLAFAAICELKNEVDLLKTQINELTNVNSKQ